MTRSAKPKLLAAAAACLLWPLWAAGESQLGSEQRSAAGLSAARAHVLFRIVIAEQLSLEIATSERAGAPKVIVSGNDRKTPVDAQTPPILLGVAGHRSIAQFAVCRRTESAQSVPALSCTVAMP
jgi:hypothetical protein